MFGRKIIHGGLISYMNYSNKFLQRIGVEVFFLCIKSKPSIIVKMFKGIDSKTGTKFIPPIPTRK